MSEKKAPRGAYGEALVKLGATNDKVVVLDSDLAAATPLTHPLPLNPVLSAPATQTSQLLL